MLVLRVLATLYNLLVFVAGEKVALGGQMNAKHDKAIR
jgi:hypothetical protein